MIEDATPAETAPLIQESYGFSARESEITRLVVLGLSTAEIAQQLVISSHTVQDHLKSIFEKAGVRSRRALVARIFEQHYRTL
jgi:DNA-binding CsgD family transcriptional regulator